MRAKGPHHCGTARCKHASPEKHAALYIRETSLDQIPYTPNLDLVHAPLAQLRSGRQAFPSLPFNSPYNKPTSQLYLPSLFPAFSTTIGAQHSDYMAASSSIPLNLQWIFMLDYDIRNSRVARLLVDSHKLVDLYRVRWVTFASFGRSGQWQMSRLTEACSFTPQIQTGTILQRSYGDWIRVQKATK
jgi:hypothetical protein